jgi:hypothetical protein
MRVWLICILLPLACLAKTHVAVAQDAGIEFFEKRIRPLLVEHCYECHSTGAKKVRGGLLLDSRPALQKGGESGPAVVPGHADKSLLIKAVRFGDDNLKMPPKGKLPAAAIADLEAWIAMGSPDPRDKATALAPAANWRDVVAQRKQWWSLQPIREPAVPKGDDAAHPIDRFLLAKLREKNLHPAPPAAPHTLLRRLSFVLTGLPPTPSEIAAFERRVRETSLDAATVELTDRLLDSPHFGERWARHWMDVVRFSETHGNEWNYDVHYAWRYRDYLIRAFNADLPYDQLIREHIAGDLLASPRWNTREKFNESVIGTAFWRFGEVNHDDCVSLRTIGYDLADNQIDTLTKGFQALTVACARCHDHKLDAVSMRDYYGLLGVIRSSRCVSHTIDAADVNADVRDAMRSKKQALRQHLADAWLREAEPERVAKWLADLPVNKLPADDPLLLWQQLREVQRTEKIDFAEAFTKVADRIRRDEAERQKAQASDFITLARFQEGAPPNWQSGGQGLRDAHSNAGDFVVAAEGDRAVARVLPAGCFTNRVSDKLNGTLRSPVLTGAATRNKKWISFRVVGNNTSAVRLVSNNCQLNYANYKALTSDQWQWLTFELPDDRDSLNVYAELMTKFDNPKFPDQLGTLGGDTKNERVPFEKAAENPRSYFGITEVVLHDGPIAPKPNLAHLLPILTGPLPKSEVELAGRYAERLASALRAWKNDRATDDDVMWLNAFLERGGLSNRKGINSPHDKPVTDYRDLDAKLVLPRIVPGLADSGRDYEQPVFLRGDCFKPGEKAPRRYVEILSPRPFSPGSSGRLELAERIASRDNPLTARVMVNRVWHHLFGAGLVRTVDDFGHVGDLPSHPELLDWLAVRFMDDGWSVKRLIRSIVLTRAFRAAHEPSEASLAADPDNRLLSHYPARRMEAEAIRDALLATSGRLDRAFFGPSIPGYRDKDNADRRLFRGPLDGNGRRSIYIKVTLMEAPAFLEAFNIPGGKVTQGRRDVTQAPAQALAMLNDPLVREQADVWSRRLIGDKNDDVERRIASMFLAAVGREPTATERERFTAFAKRVADLQRISEREMMSHPAVWREVCHALFNIQEFVTIP